MQLGARFKAATEVLDDIFTRHRPASTALSDWGKGHRFAGSGDRAAIGTLVYDVLRRKQSLAAMMGAETSRALVLGAAVRAYGLSPADVARAADGSKHCLEPLTEAETAALAAGLAAEVPAHIAADVPEWLMPAFTRAFGDDAIAEAQAMGERAPVDLRVNTLKATREAVLDALAPYGVKAGAHSPVAVRVPAPFGQAKAPHVEAEAAHGRGWFEVQDEGSQIAALLAGAKPGMEVLDLCAGAGGKTLALAAAMENQGRISAYDSDKHQLRPIFERITRAGATIIDVLDAGHEGKLKALGPRSDIVLIDAPCSGSGTWRRRPDSKWRLSAQAVEARIADQRHVLATGRGLVKPGGLLVYVTCSVLPQENGDQIEQFLTENSGFSLLAYGDRWRETIGGEAPASADGSETTLLLTPRRHGTDGFFVALLRAPD